MKFHYFLDNNAGWAGLIFEEMNISLNYSISYCMGDELIELLGGLIEFIECKTQVHSIRYITDKRIDENGMLEWNIDEEGSNIKFQFSKTENTDIINLKIIENYDKEECVFDNNILLKELLVNIIFSCTDILSKYGIIGYSLNFMNEFPIVYYLILKDYLENEIKFDTFTEINNNREQDMYRSNIGMELKYIYLSK